MDNRARDAAIVGAYQAGASLRQIARDFDMSHERIRQILKDEGAAVRTRSDAVKLTKQERQ